MYILPGALAPLATYRQFILVLFTPRSDRSGKSDKFPMNPLTLSRHDAHDPAIRMSWQEASILANSLGSNWGIGFVLTANDPFCVTDLDGCANGLGGWDNNALEMLGKIPGAIELSNSGQGLHVWSTYTRCPPHGKRNNKRNMEFYTDKRFIAMGSSASGAMCDVTDILPAFITEWFDPKDELTNDDWTEVACNGYTFISDEELFIRARARVSRKDATQIFGSGPGYATLDDLYSRNLETLRSIYPPMMPGKELNGSDADFALAKELSYWTGRNCERIRTLMYASQMKRDKWEYHRGYLAETILRAVAACQAVHHVKPLLPITNNINGKIMPSVIEHNTFIGRENMAILFDNCVYIQDDNAILLPNGDVVDQARFKVKFAGYTFAMDNANEKSTKDAWDAFINNSVIAFPRVEGTSFDPAQEFQSVSQRGGRSWVNIYKKPEVIRTHGDVQPFMSLLKKLLPNGDDALIVLCYMAAVCQYPGTKFRWAPFIQGVPGNGKSTIVSCLKYALGNKYIFSIKAGMIENTFNSWLERNILYVADDIYSSRDRTDMMESLKSMITETDHGITLKGIDAIQKIICGNFIFTDNHKDAMKKTDDSRRLCTLYCAQQSRSDRIRDGLTKQFFVGPNGLVQWLKSGGYSYVAEMLHTMEIDPRYNPAGECQEAPDTSATQEAIVDGRTGIEHEVSEWIELEEPGFCGGYVSATMLKRKMESNPRFSKSGSYLKIKEMMTRLGYELHRGLKDGRCASNVSPDNTRPILFVKSDSPVSQLRGEVEIGVHYAESQMAAMTAEVTRRMTNG